MSSFVLDSVTSGRDRPGTGCARSAGIDANIADLLLSQGVDRAVAISHRDRNLSYSELRERVAATASFLLSRGHQKGDRVGVFAENSCCFVVAYLGIIRAGLIAVPFQTETMAASFARIVRDTGLREIIVSERFRDRLKPWTQEAGVTLQSEFSVEHANVRGQQFPEIDPTRDVAAILYTSGSTGVPKGVMVSHRNIECNTRDIVDYVELSHDDRVMVVLPFHYCFGLSLLHTHLLAGASLVLNNQFKLFPEEMLQEMRRRACTGFAGVPSTYQILLRRSRLAQMEFPALRWLQQAGGKLANIFIGELMKLFPRVRIYIMYGQTEATARLSYLPPESLADRLGSVGKGLPKTRLEVLKQDGTPVKPGSDEVGEIVATGGNISPGYWHDAMETARYFANGSLRTGDLARVDAEGYIYIVEREREFIKSGGHRVSAKEVEEVIAEMPGVVEVAVIGCPHELLGEAIKAFTVLVPGENVSAAAIVAHCRKRLPAHKVPEQVLIANSLPHSSAGKILKQRLRELMTSSLAPAAAVPAPCASRVAA